MKRVYFINKGRRKLNNPVMRYLKLFVVTTAMIPLTWSCGFLDYNELDQYNKEDIFYEFDRVKSVLNNVYSYLPDDFRASTEL